MTIGEIGLSGEIRMVSQIEARLKEAEKRGFTKAILPEGIFNIKQFKPEKYKIKIYPVKQIRDVARFMNS